MMSPTLKISKESELHVSHKHSHSHAHVCYHEVNVKTIRYLIISFIINMVLSLVEIIAGILAGSVALIGDALHNTSDAFSILIAVVAFKIGLKKADMRYTYGFKRAESIGGFVNLILLFISGIYLIIEGFGKLIKPESINGPVIIWVSLLALMIDVITARLSYQHSAHNTNMKMLFLHNLADALGSIGVIISGFCVIYLNWFFIDGLVALGIAIYMIYQSIISFPKVVRILMNAVPEQVSLNQVIQTIESIEGIQSVHHIHLWAVDERDMALECHIVAANPKIVRTICDILYDRFHIRHCNIQVEENESDCPGCCLSKGE